MAVVFLKNLFSLIFYFLFFFYWEPLMCHALNYVLGKQEKASKVKKIIIRKLDKNIHIGLSYEHKYFIRFWFTPIFIKMYTNNKMEIISLIKYHIYHSTFCPNITLYHCSFSVVYFLTPYFLNKEVYFLTKRKYSRLQEGRNFLYHYYYSNDLCRNEPKM